jgi:hypothetical protein
VKSPKEVFDRLFFRPEIAEQFGRILRKFCALLRYQSSIEG